MSTQENRPFVSQSIKKGRKSLADSGFFTIFAASLETYSSVGWE